MSGAAPMAMIAIYGWDQIGVPSALTPEILSSSNHGNAPGTAAYDPAEPSWVNQSYTYLGGSPTQVKITDDDALFEDGLAETGTPQVLAEAVTIGGTTYLAGSVIENEFSLYDASGAEVWVVRIDGENVGFAPQASYPYIPAGSQFTPVGARDGASGASSDGTASVEPYSGVVCFDEATAIATPGGPVAAGRLAPGALVLTVDHGPQPIRWVTRERRRLGAGDAPDRPILFPPGTLGPDSPTGPLIVSPQHRIGLAGPEIAAAFGADEVLAPARGLLPLRGVRVMRGRRMASYVHLLLDRHEVLLAEGAPAESFHPGETGRMMLSARDRRTLPVCRPGTPARPLLTVAEARGIAARLRRLDLPAVAPGAFAGIGGPAAP